MKIQKLQVEVNKFGAAEVSAKIDNKNYEMLVIAAFKPYETWVASKYAVAMSNGITLTNVDGVYDLETEVDNSGADEYMKGVIVYLFKAADAMLESGKPEPLPRAATDNA